MLRSRSALAAAALLLSILAVSVTAATGSNPPVGAISVPTTIGQMAVDNWTGTIPPGSAPQNTCTGLPDQIKDFHQIQVTVPAGAYNTVRAKFRFVISWTPVTNINVSDEVITVYGPNGAELGSHDGGTATEELVFYNLPAGLYTVAACGFANAQPQPYAGKLEITAEDPIASLPSAPAQGLEFSAAVAADNQRDESEPLMEIDRDGKIYTCGPTGFSNSSDYAQVSTDFGDQFHMLGTPPRGQQGSGGGGDCGLATGVQRNASNKYQYAYSGLGALTGFTTATSPDNGHTLTTGGPQQGGVTSQGGGADRQWSVFLDSLFVLMSYNQQQPRNTVIQPSSDGGLTYSPQASIAAPNPTFPGPLRFNENYTVGGAQGLVYMGWDKRGAGPNGTDSINLSISTNHGLNWTTCRASLATGNAAGFVTVDHDNQGNLYLAYADGTDYHTWMVVLPVADISKCNGPINAQPTANPGFSTPVQVDRDLVRSTVFPWLTAGGIPGRVAITFYGTESDGNPNTGTFKASWDVYVNQSLNALDPARTFSQVKATTHPFHYDSICLNGLACDTAVPPGDRSLADFFAIDYNAVDGRLSVVFNRGNKKPDEATGHVASPMVTTQIGGPSLNGGTIAFDPAREVVRGFTVDPPNDALARYSSLGVNPGPINEPAMDFVSAYIRPGVPFSGIPFPAGSQAPSGGAEFGFVVVLTVKDLSNAYLTQAMADTGSQSLLWIWRFTNGFQDAAASARYSPGAGFTFGYNDYTVGSAPCEPGAPAASEKCSLYPGSTGIQGAVDQATGKIELQVLSPLLRALSGPTGDGQRPAEVPAVAGSRLYDGTAFSLGNTISALQTAQTFLYPFDNTRSMDFLVPGPTAVTLRTFAASREGRDTVLRWRTGSELGNLGFNLYRGKRATRTKLNRRLITSAASGTPRGHLYTWKDRASSRGTRYWLQEVRADGKRVLHGPVVAP